MCGESVSPVPVQRVTFLPPRSRWKAEYSLEPAFLVRSDSSMPHNFTISLAAERAVSVTTKVSLFTAVSSSTLSLYFLLTRTPRMSRRFAAHLASMQVPRSIERLN